MAKKLKVDMTGVDKEIRKGGRATKVPEGEYLVKVVDCTIEKSKRDDGGRYLRWKCQIVEGVDGKKYRGKTIYGNTSLKRDALWSLRNLINAALGKNMAGKAFNFDPEKVYGKIVGASVSDNEWEQDGKARVTSQVDSFFPKAEFASDDNEEEDEETEEDEEEETEEDEEDEELEDVDVEDL